MIDKNKTDSSRGIDSLTVHGYSDIDPYTGAVSYPIYQTSTFRNPSLYSDIKYSYSRCANPTREELENTVAVLEGGVAGFAFTSGLAAIMATFSLLRAGDHCIVSDDIYGGTYRQIELYYKNYNIEFTYIDTGDTDAVKASIRPNTKMIYVETPTNPMMKVSDIKALSDIAKANGAYLVVDNTFLTPIFQKPISLGADVVVHSGTKFLAGHHDTIAGFAVVNSEELAGKFELASKTHGTPLSPFDSWLVMRGIKTLSLRMHRHEENALKVADFLVSHPKVESVYFVGLKTNKSYDVSCKQASGFGGMISFTLKDSTNVAKVLSGGKMIMFAESLGGTATLITYPLTQTHSSIPKEIRDRLGITDKLLRLSVGIEDVNDIINDLDLMLQNA